MGVPRRVAVISDIHANLVALRAVLADLDAHDAGEIVVTGDAIGFGPNPAEVVDLLRERGARMIRGNHEKDYVAAEDRQGWSCCAWMTPFLSPIQ